MLGRDRIQYKSREQVLAMRRAGLVVGETLELVRETVRPGLTTADLDTVAEKHIRSAGATPSWQRAAEQPADVTPASPS